MTEEIRVPIGKLADYPIVGYGLPKMAELVELIALIKHQEKWMKEFFERSIKVVG